VSAREAAAKARDESEERYRLLVSQMRQGLALHEILLDDGGRPVDYRFLETNDAFETLTGLRREEIVGKTVREILPSIEDDWIERYGRVALTGQSTHFENYAQDLGKYYEVDAYSPKAGQFAVIMNDVTERRRLEQERQNTQTRLVQQQKLEAIGTLASGVAHEINNPLFGIINYAEVILDDLGGENANAVYLRGIVEEGTRISTIVRNLLQFSRQEQQSFSASRVEDVVDRALSLMRVVLRRDDIHLSVTLEADLPDLMCRSQQIQQVLMNFLTNARDALNARYPGSDPDKRILIGCRRFLEDDRPWIDLSVEDHGTGIPDDQKQKIFEPFYSTRPKEIGTGLGLSISDGIARDHFGRIEVESEPDRSTTFHLCLPVDGVRRSDVLMEDREGMT